MSFLWGKEWHKTDDRVIRFTSAEDAELDNQLIPFDIIGSLAHARGLERIGILDEKETAAIAAALGTAFESWQAGGLRLQPDDEDVHTALERILTDELGDVGKKIHTGRSRNDQVLTALRLLMKRMLLERMRQLTNLVLLVCDRGESYSDVLMPGYTHMQRAMPSTVAHWYASFAEGFCDTLDAGEALLRRLDSSPLGAAAGFGVPLPLDRAYTAELMGFSRVQVNTQAVQNSRGRLEASFIGWLVELGRDVEKAACDLLLFSSAEFGFVRIPESLSTGSSIMPQKRNPDVVELLRATPSVLVSCRDEVESIAGKLPSGYHRDLQMTKKPLLRAVGLSESLLVMSSRVLESLEWDEERLRQCLSQEMLATHRALGLVRDGIPFRAAYQQAASELCEGKTEDWSKPDAAELRKSAHLGSPFDPGITEARARAKAAAELIQPAEDKLDNSWQRLLGR